MMLSLPILFLSSVVGTVEQAAAPFVKWADHTFGVAEYGADRPA
jgi:hypothetical protein